MFLQNLNIFEIRNDAIKAISDRDGKIWVFIFYYGLPILVSYILFKYNYRLNKEVSGNLISGISLLSGLMFSLLVVITNNYSRRRSKLNHKEDEHVRYLENYKSFSNNLIAVISYVVVKSIVIIVFLVFANSYYEYIDQKIDIVFKLSWSVIYILLIQYVIFVLYIIKNMYAMLYDDINQN